MNKHIASLTVFSLVALLVVSACVSPAAVQPVKWRMATSWPDNIFFYTGGAKAIADRVARMSGGRLVIETYPGDTIVKSLEVFDAVAAGKVEVGHSWCGYWREKDPTFELFSSVPNQMTEQEWLVWLYGPANGMGLWREFYAGYGVVPFAGGLTGPEFGFLTNTPIHTLADFKGLKLRAAGTASDLLRELGASTVTLAAGDIAAAMKRGDLNGCEFSTPIIDWQLGLQDVAKYAVMPSWHQPSGLYETIVNQAAWNSLPADLQAIFEAATKEVGIVDYMAYLEGSNAEYLRKFEQAGVQVTVLSEADMKTLTAMKNSLTAQHASKNAFFARVLKSQQDFRESYRTWEKWSDYKLYPATP